MTVMVDVPAREDGTREFRKGDEVTATREVVYGGLSASETTTGTVWEGDVGGLYVGGLCLVTYTGSAVRGVQIERHKRPVTPPADGLYVKGDDANPLAVVVWRNSTAYKADKADLSERFGEGKVFETLVATGVYKRLVPADD